MAKLAADFPHLTILEAAGVTTEAQLAKYDDDYTQISGIGPAFAKDIAAAVAQPAEMADETPQPAPALAPSEGGAVKQQDEPRKSGQPVSFCYTSDTVISGVAFENSDGTWDVEAGGRTYRKARQVNDQPRVPGEFQLTQAASA